MNNWPQQLRRRAKERPDIPAFGLRLKTVPQSIETLFKKHREDIYSYQAFKDFRKLLYGDQHARQVSGKEFDKIDSIMYTRGIDDKKYLNSNIDGSFVGESIHSKGLNFSDENDEGYLAAFWGIFC